MLSLLSNDIENRKCYRGPNQQSLWPYLFIITTITTPSFLFESLKANSGTVYKVGQKAEQVTSLLLKRLLAQKFWKILIFVSTFAQQSKPADKVFITTIWNLRYQIWILNILRDPKYKQTKNGSSMFLLRWYSKEIADRFLSQSQKPFSL